METVKVKICLEIEVEVSGEYHKPTPGRMHLYNGDPGYPDEPAMFEIKKVVWNGAEITKQLDEDNFDWESMEEDILESY